MLTIGLTGPSGAGKGVIASLLAGYGVPSIDTDKVYHRLLIPPSACLDELVGRFGSGILHPDGTLDRKALAALVFAEGHEQDLADLNAITHRHILDEVRVTLRRFDAEGIPAVLVDAPQLFESKFDSECGFILSVLAPYEVRLARIMARDGLDEARAKARLAASHDDIFFTERSDAVILNGGDIPALEDDVRRLLTQWGVAYEN